MKHRAFKVALIFSILVFIIMVASMFTTVFLTMAGMRLGIIRGQNREVMLVAVAIVSAALGIFFSRHVGKRPINTIIQISEATKEVAKGNFAVRLDENIRVAEMRVMAQNFNHMTRELASIEMFRNDFIENVSHEFKTPLTAIEGYVTLLQNKSLPAQRREAYIQKILLNTRRLSSLTGNVLLLSRLENQEFSLKREKFSLDEQIREVILMLEPQWGEKDLELDIDLQEANILGNQELLFHVWQNIIGNAVKFVGNGGRIRVSLCQTPLKTSVTVSDNGPGMSPEVIRRIYEKFYQGDRSHTGSGNGLGLALAQRIVLLHHGQIEAKSEEGQGSAFTVTLPRE